MNIANVDRQPKPVAIDANATPRRAQETVEQRPAPESASAGRADAAAEANAAASKTPQTSPELSRESLEKLVESVSEQVNMKGRDLSFVIDDDLGRTIIKVIDATTDEVVRQIPSEELLRVAEALRENSAAGQAVGQPAERIGLLIQEQA